MIKGKKWIYISIKQKSVLSYDNPSYSVLSCERPAMGIGWISREDDGDSGGTFGGILGTIIFFGVIWLLVTIFGDKKKPDPNSHSDFHNDELDVPYYDDDDDDYDPIMFNDDYVDEPFWRFVWFI